VELVSSEIFLGTVLPTSSLYPEHRGCTGYEQTYLALRNKLNKSQNNLMLFRSLRAERATEL